MPSELSISPALPALPALFALTLTFGCSAPIMPTYETGFDATRADAGAPSSADTDADADADPGGHPAPQDTGPLGVVAIDLQQVFFDTAAARNPASNIAERMTRSAHVLELAGAHHVPVFMTYEATKTGDHALPPSLAAALPAQSVELVKTTFAATSQPQFLPAIDASGARRLVVIGAETDVCVLQTVLGLRRAGYNVIGVMDALFTEEVNAGPATRRMQRAGVDELGMTEVEALLSSGDPSPAPPVAAPPMIVRPLETGILLHDLEGLNAADANASAKLVRLRELLLVSEWFHLPLFAQDPTSTLAALPANLKSIVTRPILPLSSRPSQITQLAVAGGRAGIGAAVATLAAKVDVFLLEDTLLGGSSADLDPLYAMGAVPTTYKTLYYELTQSVDDAGWPSQQWVQDGIRYYYDRTLAPEELPPIAVP